MTQLIQSTWRIPRTILNSRRGSRIESDGSWNDRVGSPNQMGDSVHQYKDIANQCRGSENKPYDSSGESNRSLNDCKEESHALVFSLMGQRGFPINLTVGSHIVLLYESGWGTMIRMEGLYVFAKLKRFLFCPITLHWPGALNSSRPRERPFENDNFNTCWTERTRNQNFNIALDERECPYEHDPHAFWWIYRILFVDYVLSPQTTGTYIP